MSEEESEQPTARVHVTTQENALAEKPAEWQMPEPVYRQTSGYLPQGFEKQFPQNEVQSPLAVATAPAPVATDSTAATVEPQPDLIEVLAAEPPIPPVVARPGRSALSVVLIVVGLLAMAAVVVGFLIVVYYLFIAAPAETSF